MKWGKVEVTGGFLVLIAWLNYLDRQLLVPLALLACALHELGHYAVLHWLGINIKEIRLTVIGAEMELVGPMSWWQEGMVALAGPGVNLLLANLACRWEGGSLFAGLNLALACFNLLPVGGLDGGRVLRCVLACAAGADLAQRTGEWLDLAVTACALALGGALLLFCGNITLLLAAIWMARCYGREKRRKIGVAIQAGNG